MTNHRDHQGWGHGLRPGTTQDMNCAPCQREDREDGTMTMAQICAMWRNDARDLRSRAGTATDTYGTVMRARADQLGICARELALNLHTGEAQT